MSLLWINIAQPYYKWDANCNGSRLFNVSTNQPTQATPLGSTRPACYHGQVKRRSKMFNPSWILNVGTNFPIITPHIQPTISDQNLFVVVVVNSYSGKALNKTLITHQLLRNAIRETWGKDMENNCTVKWGLFFSLGMSKDEKSNANNRLEAVEYNDLIIGHFEDHYKNIAIKTFMAHFWAFNTFSCRYVLKTDDDVYVRVNKLVHWLHDTGSPGRFVGGLIHPERSIVRKQNGRFSKWYISRQQFNESIWPPFCYGAFHVVSTDVLPAFFYYTQLRKPFHTDDAYLGVAARDLGIRIKQIPGFTMEFMPKTDCQFRNTIAIGHELSPASLKRIHKTYESLLKKNVTC